ncbi:Ubiquitin-related modifier 1 [Mycena chlorophos]|uniref:Ubiquitin-related modifier 1 n=1 Tax=Mycena chlorophos TaxID=658473 RepID=A0A8H6TKF2_MYCCL|nr:Ubiquitin-related modifier 1 [Mycena chlorophos]
MSSDTIALKVEFGGGLELLFSNERTHKVTVPATVPRTASGSVSGSGDGDGETKTQTTKPADIAFLIRYLRDNLLKERDELFMENETVRPGILVLVNDTDWELEGEGEYALKNGDEIVFISTLHGG